MTRSRTLGALSVALVAALALPACGSSSATSGEFAESASATSAAAATTVAGSAALADAGPGRSADGKTSTIAPQTSPNPLPGGPTPVPAPPADRKVIVAVTLDVEVANVATAGAKVASMAETLGGYVQSQQAAFAGDRPSSTIVLKVPPARVTDLLTSVAGLGKVVNQTQQAEDVTAQFVDLESRISTARASVARVREFLGRTTNVNELAGLEAELTRRETELEQLVATQQGLAARSAMATVTIGLVPLSTVVTTTTVDNRPMSPGRALHRGTDALVSVARAVAILAAFLLPFLPVLLVLSVVVAIVRRRTARRRAATPGPAPLPSPTPVVVAPEVEREQVDA